MKTIGDISWQRDRLRFAAHGEIAQEMALTALEGEARSHFETSIIGRLEVPFAIRPACNLVRQSK